MRRVAAAFALWLCAAIPAFAQNRENLPLVGILRINTPDTVEPFATGFKDALAALGLVDGRNIRLEGGSPRGISSGCPSSPNRWSGRRRAS